MHQGTAIIGAVHDVCVCSMGVLVCMRKCCSQSAGNGDSFVELYIITIPLW